MREKVEDIGIALALLTGLIGCTSFDVQAPHVVRLGLVVPASGPDIQSGEAAENGARLAIEELNRERVLVGGRRIRFELLVVDEGRTTSSAVAAARIVANSNVKGVLGHLSRGTATAASQIYADAGMPFLTPIQLGTDFGPGLRTNFTIGPTEAPSDVANLATLAARAVGMKNVAVVSDRTFASASLASAFISDATASGIGTKHVDVSSSSVDFSEVFQHLKTSRPDGVLFTGSPERTDSFVKQLAKSEITTRLVSAGQPCLDRISHSPYGTIDVVCASPSAIADVDVSTLSDFKTKYIRKFRALDLPVSNVAYDSVKVLAQAMRRADSVDAANFLPSLNDSTFGGVGTPIVFGSEGDSRREPVIVYASSRGKSEPVATYRMTGSIKSTGSGVNSVDSFPWPPPSPSSMLVLARNLMFGSAKGNQTLGQIDAKFAAALVQAGYVDKSYYEVPGGYALVTRLERISVDGRPDFADRFPSAGSESKGMSISKYLRSLFNAPLGRYRVIVFVVTDKAFQPSANELTNLGAAQLLSKGFNRLPDALVPKVYGQTHDCTALIYEFETSVANPKGRRISVEEAISAAIHLERSQVLAALGGS